MIIKEAETSHQTLHWGHFTEDRAQARFLETIIPMLIHHFAPSVFDITQALSFTGLQASSWKEVSKYAGDACIEAARSGLHLCVVIRDLEEVNCVRMSWQEAFTTTVRQVRESIPAQARSIACIGIPVKTIEYWLWYLQHFFRGDSVEPQYLEDYPQNGKPENDIPSVKSRVYNYKRTVKSAKVEQECVKNLCAQVTIAHLEQLAAHSPSFQAFFGEMQQRVQGITTSTLA
jgi:hypothetical protein